MKKKFLGSFIIGSAIIWGTTLIGAAFLMRGFEGKTQVISTLSSGAVIHLIIIWGPLAARIKKELGE
ncbi:hypothetical protein ACFLYK_02695 [Candidatus Cloacimonadota bacterium]